MTPEPQFRYFLDHAGYRYKAKLDGSECFKMEPEKWIGTSIDLGMLLRAVESGNTVETTATGTALAETPDAGSGCSVCGEPWKDHDIGVPHPTCPKPPLPGKSWGTPDAGSGGEVPANFKRSGSAFCECDGKWVCDYCEHFKPPTPGAGVAGDAPDTWDAIKADHAKVTFWRTGWQRRGDKPKPPFLQTTAEYVVRRWNRANRRMSAIMVRGDKLREREEQPTEPGESRTPRTDAEIRRLYGDRAVEHGDERNHQVSAKLTRTLERELADARAEVERLTGCLKTANANHKKFERLWYLEQDKLEQSEQTAASLQADNARLKTLAESNGKLAHDEAILSAGLRKALEATKAALIQVREDCITRASGVGKAGSPTGRTQSQCDEAIRGAEQALSPAGGGEEGFITVTVERSRWEMFEAMMSPPPPCSECGTYHDRMSNCVPTPARP